MPITAPTDCSATQCCVVLYTEVMHCATHDTRPATCATPGTRPRRPTGHATIYELGSGI